MDNLLLRPRPATSTASQDEPLLSISASPHPTAPTPTQVAANGDTAPPDLSTEAALLAALRNAPSNATLAAILKLCRTKFDIRASSPAASQLVKCLLETTLPDHWATLTHKQRAQLAKALTSPTGLGGLVARLRALIPRVRDRDGAMADAERGNVDALLELLELSLGHAGSMGEVWAVAGAQPEVKRDLLWREYVTLVAGGRLLAVAAEAESVMKRGPGEKRRWVGDGLRYCTWLAGEAAATCLKLEADSGAWKALALLITSGFRLGYSGTIVDTLTHGIVRSQQDQIWRLQKLLSCLSAHGKRSYLISFLNELSDRNLKSAYPTSEKDWWQEDVSTIAGAAALLQRVMNNDEEFRDILMEWLTSGTGGGVGKSIAIRRVIITVLMSDQLSFRALFEKSMQQFADKLWIRHTPLMRQEVNVQILLLCAGAAHRANLPILTKLAKGADFLNGVSNRLAASSQRARFLGMIVGEAFSRFTDNAMSRMTFGVEETESEEARWWKSITKVEDRVGDVQEFYTSMKAVTKRAPVKKEKPASVSVSKPSTAASTSASAITVLDDSDSDSDGFTPYAKPDSDPEDSADEDATTIDRSKPTAPVYIRDLILYLRATDSYDKQHLALTHAAALIRRKSASRELTSHLSPLAALLAALDDRYELPSFATLRLNALIALTVAAPLTIGPWLAQQFVSGDYGLAQRAVLLTTIGLSARELAGLTPPPAPPAPSAAAARIAARWGADPDPLAPITHALTTSLVASAAPTPVRTSRRAPPPPTAARALHAVVGPAFFAPLTGLWWVATRDGNRAVAHPHLIATFVRTLAVVLDAAGSAAPGLGEMGGEMWRLLLALRGVAAGEAIVREAVLLAVLVLVEVSAAQGVEGRRRMVEERGRELVEMKEWVEGVFEDAEGEERGLAAAVLVKIGEVVEEFQKSLWGELEMGT
ncbi:telomere length regulation protein-domain-containing protein [Geopyxis carbonaria]|nr:telomere length regulation protein-domain-containing protein [Geopyxis carbonaria]